MKILLTGATGFLGAQIARRLERENVQTALLVRPKSNLGRIDPLPKNAQLIQGSLQDLPETAIKNFAPDLLIHTAWHGVTNEHRNDPAQVSQNIGPALKLLELAREAGAKTFIGLGSQAEYGPLNRVIREDDPTSPTTVYGAAKLAACHLTRVLAAQYGMRWAWLRVFSTYGPMEDLSWMLPYLIRRLLRGEKPSLTGCEQKWDFLFGPDAADAVWSVANTPTVNGIFNLGSGRGDSLLTTVETLRNAIDPKLPLGIGDVPYRPDQVMHLEADITRLTSATSWRPATSLEDGIRQTVAWHKADLAK